MSDHTSELERRAVALASDGKLLRARLLEARSVLSAEYRKRFKAATLDLAARRLVSADGRLILQWLTRPRPGDAPTAHYNQQASAGTVVCIELD